MQECRAASERKDKGPEAGVGSAIRRKQVGKGLTVLGELELVGRLREQFSCSIRVFAEKAGQLLLGLLHGLPSASFGIGHAGPEESGVLLTTLLPDRPDTSPNT